MLKLPLLNTLITPLTLALSLVIATPSIAEPQHGRNHERMPLHHVLSKLDLNKEQRQDVKQILQQSRADAELVAEDVKQARADLRNFIHADSWNETAVTTTLQQHQQTKASLDLARASAMHQVWLLLSDEQKTKFALLAERTPDGKRDNKEGKAKHKDRAESEERFQRGGKDHFAKLTLTDEQKTVIKTIKQQAKAQNTQTKQQEMAFRQAERALIASAAFNESAYQALQANYQDEHLQHALLMAKTRHDIWNVLSTEQQAQALAKMEERRARS